MDRRCVAASWEQEGLISCHIMLLVQLPVACGEAEGPDIIQLLIFFVLPTENDEPILIDDRGMSGSRRRGHLTLWFDDLPFLALEVESVDQVCVDSINKAPENDHRISSIESC